MNELHQNRVRALIPRRNTRCHLGLQRPPVTSRNACVSPYPAPLTLTFVPYRAARMVANFAKLPELLLGRMTGRAPLPSEPGR